MLFVLDASVTLGWCYDDESQHLTDHVSDLREHGHTVLVPIIWWFEIRNAALMGVKRQRITVDRCARFLTKVSEIPLKIAGLPDESHEFHVFTLARKHNLTFYDAAYLELAQREGIAIATLDKSLASAAKTEGISLIDA